MLHWDNFDAPKGFYKEDNTTPNDVIVVESKQNSDAAGLLYQWGRKDPFTFATKTNGTQSGFNPIKIYNAQGKEIVQTLNGLSDTNGGITVVTEQASLMLETVKKPNTFYAAGVNNAMINPKDLTKDIWDYYWTSYSRGTDGAESNPLVRNLYLDGYNQKRSKSIFDPCPYGFRLSTNGTYNMFPISYSSGIQYSYVGGYSWQVNVARIWLQVLGFRTEALGQFNSTGLWGIFWTSSIANNTNGYNLAVNQGGYAWLQHNIVQSRGHNIRCIED